MRKKMTIPLVASPWCTITKLRSGACFGLTTPNYPPKKPVASNSSQGGSGSHTKWPQDGGSSDKI